ncbi:C-terminal-binding protein [Pelomyxa schiedti]|nr:C-terminal-binding protein [Pelomyxa schiedti]
MSASPQWLAVQAKVFVRWCNGVLETRGHSITELRDLFHNLDNVVSLVETLSGEAFKSEYSASSQTRIKKIAFLAAFLKWCFGSVGVTMKLKPSPEELLDGSNTQIHSFIFCLFRHFTKIAGSHDAMGELLQWASKTSGLSLTSFQKNPTSPFHNGMAFCQIMFNLFPDIPHYSLRQDDYLGNIELAQELAQIHLNIPRYLSAQEINAMDENSMMVYVSEFYFAHQKKQQWVKLLSPTTKSASRSEITIPVTESALATVAVLDWFVQAEVEQRVLQGTATACCYTLTPESDIPNSISDAVAVIRFRQPQITAAHFEKMTSAKVFICASVGYDRVDLEAAGKLGIRVVHIPDYCTEEVADSALCLILLMLRQTMYFSKCVERGEWPFLVHTAELPASRVRGKNLGIIGLGRIGTALALRAKVVGMNVTFFDPFLKDGVEKSIGIERVNSLEELIASADVISLNCNLTSENVHLINSAALQHAKRGSFLVNTARGPLVEERALLDALSSGLLRGAALDVLEKEPCTDRRYSNIPNLIVTPHSAHFSQESALERRTKAAQVAKDVILHGASALRNVVNEKFLVNPRN